MTLLLSGRDVAELSTDELALDAVRFSFEAESRGAAVLPVRLDAPSPTGFFRTMPAVLAEYMGCKVMTLVKGLGTRYLVLLYSVASGELLGLVDADELTKIRTAATTALAARHLSQRAPQRVAVIGSGFEARGHLALFARLWNLREAAVYSRSPENRKKFVSWASAEFGMPVTSAMSCQEALQNADTVLLATKSPTQVVDGTHFAPGAVVLSIGSTRPDLRELDQATFRRADVVVVDAPEHVVADSGDVIEALDVGAIQLDHIRSLAELVAQDARHPVPSGDRDLTVFKSAGTALQDLALAAAVYHRATELNRGRQIGDVTTLKPFQQS